MAQRCIRCRIQGRVQGVFFRASTRDQARRLGLHGYVRNLVDGSVEVVAAGDEQAVAALQQWLHDGPPDAKVEEVNCAPYDDPPDDSEVDWGTSFVIR